MSLVADFSYYNPVQTKFGAGIFRKSLAEILKPGCLRVGLFYGQASMQAAGVIDVIKTDLPDCRFIDFAGIPPNPSYSILQEINSQKRDFDWIIAVGGGSVIDIAKSVAFLCRQKVSLDYALQHEDFAGARAGVPVIAIPTTSGSGSEVTPWASIWDRKNKKKYSLSHVRMYPALAIVDPNLTVTLPLQSTAVCAFDALAHAFEAFWSVNANPVSDLYATEAIRLIFENLVPCLQTPADKCLRARLSQASLFAGLAFSNTKTAAVHSVSYPMTLHFDVPHGLACALTLAEFWQFNRTAINAVRVGRLLAHLGGLSPDALYLKLKELAAASGLPVTLNQAGISASGIATITNSGFDPKRIVNNPRKVTSEDLRNILEKIAN